MKLFIVLAATAVLLVAPLVQDANAQIEFTLGGGVNTPLGDYGDQANTGYAVSAGLGYRIVPLAVLGIETSYSGNKAPDEVTDAVGPGYDLTMNILQYALLAKFVFPMGDHNMFLKGTVGNYRASAKVSGPLGDASITLTEPGYGIGGGFLVNGSETSAFFADLTYHFVDYGGDGGETSFFTITAGALIRFNLSEPDRRDELQDDLDRLRD